MDTLKEGFHDLTSTIVLGGGMRYMKSRLIFRSRGVVQGQLRVYCILNISVETESDQEHSHYTSASRFNRDGDITSVNPSSPGRGAMTNFDFDGLALVENCRSADK